MFFVIFVIVLEIWLPPLYSVYNYQYRILKSSNNFINFVFFLCCEDDKPMRVWIGVRSVSKATYPGMWDQMVAGGQPAGMG